MQKLLNGLHHFQTNIFLSHRELFERLALGQNPDALFITCSDSRVDPNLFTQTEPGDLFVLRNAGNIVPPFGTANGSEAATIEFAIAALGIKDVIVCGHSHCGAMKALLNPEELEELPTVSAWLSHAEPTKHILRKHSGHLSEGRLLDRAIKQNVLQQLENLKTHPAVAERLQRRSINLYGWIYEIETGQVLSYQPSIGQFLPLNTSEPYPSAVAKFVNH